MVTEEDKELALLIVASLPGAFISGSWLVNPVHANDIDIVLTHSMLDKAYRYKWWEEFERETTEQSEKYNTDQSDNDYELVANWRYNNINLVVVNDKFYGAYLAAKEILEDRPDLFTTREQRVNLHHRLKAHVRDMFGEYAWQRYYKSEVPVSFSDLE